MALKISTKAIVSITTEIINGATYEVHTIYGKRKAPGKPRAILSQSRIKIAGKALSHMRGLGLAKALGLAS